MIKVIVSHDVDHLFSRDHWFRDLIYPKMWIRSSLELMKGSITGGEWTRRCLSCFRKERHNLEALMDFDEMHGIPSTFFFGMSQGLGMSYRPKEAVQVIRRVHERGFAVGVHGIAYQDENQMKQEHDTFYKVTGLEPCGIRMHYVRYDEETFAKLSRIGYAFDTTEFDKKNCGTRKEPYRIGDMWEFPLTLMDAYLPQKFEAAQRRTLELLEECKAKSLQYVTVLFHDYQFCGDYLDMRAWYEWLMTYFVEDVAYSFVSYGQAMEEMKSRPTVRQQTVERVKCGG